MSAPRRWLFALPLLWAAASGCATDCDELQEVCNLCRDPLHKQSCESSVDKGDEDECSRNVDAFENICR